MSYIDIDPIIKAWADKQAIHIMYGTGNLSRRHFHTSSPKGETFQIVIEPEKKGIVRVDAHLIESPTDEEAHFIWQVPKCQIENVLDLSLGSAQAWFRRNAT